MFTGVFDPEHPENPVHPVKKNPGIGGGENRQDVQDLQEGTGWEMGEGGSPYSISNHPYSISNVQGGGSSRENIKENGLD